MDLSSFLWFGLGTLFPIKGNLNYTAYADIFDKSASNFVAKIRGRPFPALTRQLRSAQRWVLKVYC